MPLLCHDTVERNPISLTTTTDTHREIFVSYGGLLMSLKGDPRNLQKIELDMRMYLLMRKVT